MGRSEMREMRIEGRKGAEEDVLVGNLAKAPVNDGEEGEMGVGRRVVGVSRALSGTEPTSDNGKIQFFSVCASFLSKLRKMNILSWKRLLLDNGTS